MKSISSRFLVAVKKETTEKKLCNVKKLSGGMCIAISIAKISIAGAILASRR